MNNIELFNIREKYKKNKNILIIEEIFKKKYNINNIIYYFLDSNGGLSEFNKNEIYEITKKFYEYKEYFKDNAKNTYTFLYLFKKLIKKNSFEPLTFFILKHLISTVKNQNNIINDEIYLTIFEFSNLELYRKIINDKEINKFLLDYIYDKENRQKFILYLLKNKNFSFVKEIVAKHNVFIETFIEIISNNYIGCSTFQKSELKNLKLFFKKIDKKYLSNKLIEEIISYNNILKKEKCLKLINFLINLKKEIDKLNCDYFLFQISLINFTQKNNNKNILKRLKTSFYLILNYVDEKNFNSIMLNKINNIIYLFVKEDIISYKYFYYLLIKEKYIDILIHNYCNIPKEDISNSKFYKNLLSDFNKSINEKNYKKIKELSFILKNYLI